MKKNIVYLIAGLALGAGIAYFVMQARCCKNEESCKDHAACSKESNDPPNKGVCTAVLWGKGRDYIKNSPPNDVALMNLKSGYLDSNGRHKKIDSWFLRKEDLAALLHECDSVCKEQIVTYEGLRFYPVLMPKDKDKMEHHSLVIVAAGENAVGESIDIQTKNVQEFLEPCPNQCPTKKITD